MAEIVNLNRAKKRRARAQDAALAQQNRVRFGRTGAEKARDQLTQAAREALLDGKQREASPGDPSELPDPPEG